MSAAVMKHFMSMEVVGGDTGLWVWSYLSSVPFFFLLFCVLVVMVAGFLLWKARAISPF